MKTLRVDVAKKIMLNEDRVLVEVESWHKETKTSSGIIIPAKTIDQKKREKGTIGVVAAVADNVSKWKIGDNVYFSEYAGHDLELTGMESYLVMNETDIIFKLLEDLK